MDPLRHLAVRVAADTGALALILATGVALVRLVPELRRRRLFERLGWAWLLGAAWLGCGAYASSFVFHVRIRPALWLALAAAPVLAALLVRREGRWARARAPRFVALAVALLVGVTALLIAEAFERPVADFDGRMTWGAQARWVAAEGTVLPRVLVEPAWSVEHPRYPLLLPLLQSLPMQLAGDFEDSRIPRAVYPPFFAAVGLVLLGASTAKAGARAGAMAVFLLVLAPFVPFENHGGVCGTYSDLPLAGFLAGGVFLLARARGGPASGAAAGFLLAAVVLAKNEGLPIALAAALGGIALAARRRGRRRHAVRAAVATAFVLMAGALLLSWKGSIPNRNDEDYVRALLHETPTLPAAARRLGSALPALPAHLLAYREWALTWFAVPLLLVLLPAWRRTAASWPVVAVILAEVAVMFAGWTLAEGPRGLAEVTASRGALQVFPLVLGLVAVALRPALVQRRYRFQANRRIG